MSVIKRRLAVEDGFTLMELMVAITIGTIVLAVILMTFDSAVEGSAKTGDRVDAVKRGRLAMEAVTQDLRSQTCLQSGTTSIVAGTSDSVTFYADLGNESSTLDRYRLTYDPTARTITEDIWNGSGTPPAVSFPNAVSRSRVLLTDADRISGVPVFRFYAFNNATPAVPNVLLPVPLSATDRNRAVRIAVAYVTSPDGLSRSDPHAKPSFESEVFLRTADADFPQNGAKCP